MLALAASLFLSAPGDILISTRTAPHTLTAGQRTSLGDIVDDLYPSVALADVITFACNKLGAGGAVQCGPQRNEALDQNTLFSLLVAGETVSQGLAGTARQRRLPMLAPAAGTLTKLGTFVGAIAPGVTLARVVELNCWRVASAVQCGVVWARSLSPAAAWTAFQALPSEESLLPLGVEQ